MLQHLDAARMLRCEPIFKGVLDPAAERKLLGRRRAGPPLRVTVTKVILWCRPALLSLTSN
jgi:hypothetical protein